MACSVALPLLVAAGIGHRDPVRTPALEAGAGCLGVALAALAFVAWRQARRGRIQVQVRVTSGAVVAALAGLGLAALGVGLPLDFALAPVVAGVVYLTAVGRSATRTAALVGGLAVIGGLSWIDGLRSLDQLGAPLLFAWLMAASALAFARVVRISGRSGVQGAVTREVVEAVGGAETLADGLTKAFPMMAEILRADHLVVFARDVTGRDVTMLGTWPALVAEDRAIPSWPAFDQALRSGRVGFAYDHGLLPIGTSEEGDMVLVARLRPLGGEAVAEVREGAEELAGALVKLTNRATYVDGLRRESRLDALTGLANRRSLLEGLQGAMARALQLHTPLAVAMIDLDHFKDYNDTYGHVAGDTLLRGMSAMMAANARGQDLVARYGGEEFCFVLPNTDLAGASAAIDRIRAMAGQVSAARPVTFSVGVTNWNGTDDTTTLIQQADLALYRAKAEGRNRTVALASARDASPSPAPPPPPPLATPR